MSGIANGFGNNGGGGMSAEVIEVTTAQFLTLVGDSELTYPATYKITDIQNGLYVETLSANTFKSEATLSFLAPDYTLHAQYHSTDGAIANGATVTWGGFYWTNISGGNVTPDLPDEADIDSDLSQFSKLSKSVANGYEAINLQVIVDTSLNIIKATDQYNNSVDLKTDGFSYGGLTIDVYQWNLSATGFYNNQAFVCNNVLESGGTIVSNQTVLGTVIKRNKIDETSGINKNSGLGDDSQVSVIENCVVRNVAFIVGNEIHLSYIKDTTVDGTGGGALIDECHLTNLSFIDGCSITGSDCYFASCWFDRESGLRNVTINTNSTALNCIELYDQTTIENYTLGNGVQTTSFISNESVDLTGFTSEFHENIENGKGWFTITHNFATSPLNSGSSVLYNLIPTGARLTNCTIIPSSLTGGVGATLRIGLETDDVSYGLAATAVGAIVNTVVNTVSNAATANRSLQLTAGVNNITGGTVTIKVEFVL